MFWLGLGLGLSIGGVLGIVIAAMCTVSKRADLQAYHDELEWRELIAQYDDDARIASHLT